MLLDGAYITPGTASDPCTGAAVTQIQPRKEKATRRSESLPVCLVGSKYLHGTASASNQGLGKSSPAPPW